ncbi:MAG TPA: glycosyltransferase family 39 protein [Thermoanaerobaculia bacterium]|nr:glycosyltransferase family 39 protein [Thermoanaerobaculia bacterium]
MESPTPSPPPPVPPDRRAPGDPSAPGTPANRRHAWLLAALLAWALLLFAIGMSWGLPSWVGWAGDELHPTSWAKALSPATTTGWHARYPPLHFAVLEGVSWPLRALVAHGLLRLEEADLVLWEIWLGRIVSLVMGLGVLYLVYRTGREIYDRRGALFATLIAASIAPLAYYAKMGNLDVPYLCWFTFSLLFYIRILKAHRLRDYLLYALLAAAAVCTKDQAYGLYTLAPLPIAFGLYRREYKDRGPIKGMLRTLVDRRLLLAGLTAAAGFALFQDLLWDPQRFAVHVRLLLGPMSEDYQDFPNSLYGHLELLVTFLRQIAFALNPALTLVCVLGLLLALWRGLRGRSRGQVFLLGSLFVLILSYYFTFLNLILFTFDRYVLPMGILLALFGGFFLGEVTRPGARYPGLRWAAVALVTAYSFLYAASVDFRLLADTRYAVEDYVWQHAKRPESVIGVGRRKHIPRFRWVPWDRAIRSSGRVFDVLQPEYVAINVTDFRHEQETAIYDRLKSGDLGYRLVFVHQSRPLLDLLDPHDVGSSQRFIDPEIALFQRLEDDGAGPPK